MRLSKAMFAALIVTGALALPLAAALPPAPSIPVFEAPSASRAHTSLC